MKRYAIRFLRPYGGYNSGEVAGFDDYVVKSLCTGPQPIAEAHGEETAALLSPPLDRAVREAPLKRDLTALRQAYERKAHAELGVALAEVLDDTVPGSKAERLELAAKLLSEDEED